MKLLVAVFVVSGLWGSAAAEGSLEAMGDVRLKGYVGKRLDAMVNCHVVGTDVDYLTAPFLEKTETKGWWQTEFWGKWMHSAVPYLKYTGSEVLRASVDRGTDRILASQEACGYIGNYPDDLRMGEGWDVWGIKYTMMGLIHFADGEGRDGRGKKALDACKRLCDYVIGEIGKDGRRGRELWQTGNWSGYASSSILEPVVWLYRRTHDRKYLDFASYIVEGMTKPEKGPRLIDLALRDVSVADRNESSEERKYVCKYGRSKAYEMMSCYQGLLDYVDEAVKVEGENQRLKDIRLAAEKSAEDIVKEEINLAGGGACSEAWFHGARKQHLPYLRLQETCVTTTWMRFCEKLLEMTGNPKWADQIERTFYNAYLGALKPDGAEFEAYTPLAGSRWHGMNHCFMHTDCCTSNGPRGFLCFLKEFFRRDGDVATFNFYGTAVVKGFDVYSLYPRTDWVRVVSHTTGSLKLRFRIPAWSEKTVVRMNGAEQSGVKAGSYFVIDRDWRLGDIVEIKFDMPVVAHTLEHSVAFTRGPVLLARDSRFGDGDLAEPFRQGIADGQKMRTFAAVQAPSDEMWMAFSATLPLGSHHENPEGANVQTVFFCDFASAGNRWSRDNYYRTWFPVEIGPDDK